MADQVWESMFCQIIEWLSMASVTEERRMMLRSQRLALPILVTRRRESESEIASLKVTCQRCLHPQTAITLQDQSGCGAVMSFH